MRRGLCHYYRHKVMLHYRPAGQGNGRPWPWVTCLEEENPSAGYHFDPLIAAMVWRCYNALLGAVTVFRFAPSRHIGCALVNGPEQG